MDTDATISECVAAHKSVPRDVNWKNVAREMAWCLDTFKTNDSARDEWMDGPCEWMFKKNDGSARGVRACGELVKKILNKGEHTEVWGKYWSEFNPATTAIKFWCEEEGVNLRV